MANAIAPKSGDPFVDPKTGVPLPRPMKWIERITSLFNTNVASVTDILDDHETRLLALEPQYVTKDNTDSPYSAADMDYITADMSAGDVEIVLPASGRVWVTRDGSSNTLTLTGTVNGAVNPTIVADGDAPALAYIGTEWRYV